MIVINYMEIVLKLTLLTLTLSIGVSLGIWYYCYVSGMPLDRGEVALVVGVVIAFLLAGRKAFQYLKERQQHDKEK